MRALVRVSVASGSRRVDLVLPGSVPVAELLPELARTVGLLGTGSAHAGYRVVTSDGRSLLGSASLTAQGVEDGGLLTIAAVVDDSPPKLYDDVVEAMEDIVERGTQPLPPVVRQVTAMVAACAFLAVGAVALARQRSGLAAAGACVMVGLLVPASIGLRRFHRGRGVGVCMAWLGIGFAALSGFALAPDRQPVATLVAAAGAGTMVVGALATVGLAGSRLLVGPAVGIGAILTASGSVIGYFRLPADVGFATVLVLVVVAGSACPWLALGVIGARSRVDDCMPVDLGRLERDALLGHEILLTASLAVCGTVVVLTPFAVAGGLPGTGLAVSACLVLALRTRHHRVGSEVLVGVASCVLGLLSTAATVLWLHPGWQPYVAAAALVAGGCALVPGTLGARPSVQRNRLGNLAEFTALASLAPLLMLAGVLENVRV